MNRLESAKQMAFLVFLRIKNDLRRVGLGFLRRLKGSNQDILRLTIVSSATLVWYGESEQSSGK
jgi:hypothetical protein